MDKSQMKLMAGGKDLKVPELDLATDATNFRAGRNMSTLTGGQALSKLRQNIQGSTPIKGLHTMQGNLVDQKNLTFSSKKVPTTHIDA